MRTLLASLLATAPLFACSCLNTASPCSAMSGRSTIVFLGKVLVDSGEGWGTGPARVLVEETLWNVPMGWQEVDIDTSAGTSCYRRLKAGERYVIFAYKGDGPQSRLSAGGCSDTFLLRGKEHILDALRNQSRGGPSRLVGAVQRSTGPYMKEGAVPGALVVARSSLVRYEAVADALGRYEILGMAPGQYQLEVSRTGFVPDTEYNHRWSGRMVLNKETNTVEPDKAEPPGSVMIADKACHVWDLSMWPAGRISGTVTGVSGAPLAGITVQAFGFNDKGEREPRPIRTGVTDQAGTYVIEPLPNGDYVVGVNAEKYTDAEPYPPTLYKQAKDCALPARIAVFESGVVTGINLVLPPKRAAATLRATVLAPDGRPYSGALVTLDNLAGVQRWYSRQNTNALGEIDLPVYIGEQYIVDASAFESLPRDKQTYDYLGGKARLDVTHEHPAVSITLAPKRFRDER